MNLLKKRVRLKTSYGNAQYIREPLASLKVKYEANVTRDHIEYTAYLSGREFNYLSDYIYTLAKVGVYPVLLD